MPYVATPAPRASHLRPMWPLSRRIRAPTHGRYIVDIERVLTALNPAASRTPAFGASPEEAPSPAIDAGQHFMRAGGYVPFETDEADGRGSRGSPSAPSTPSPSLSEHAATADDTSSRRLSHLSSHSVPDSVFADEALAREEASASEEALASPPSTAARDEPPATWHGGRPPRRDTSKITVRHADLSLAEPASAAAADAAAVAAAAGASPTAEAEAWCSVERG